MDVGYFLRARIAFIRRFYDTAAEPFVETKRKIEAQEPPFVPGCSEDEEPPFLAEWQEADESLCILGYHCVSMLATALHLFLKEWEVRLGSAIDKSLVTVFKNDGWLKGYRAHFEHVARIRFEDAPAQLGMLAELVLARNRIQHPGTITNQRAAYSATDMSKLPSAFFVDEREMALIGANEDAPTWLFTPTLRVTAEKLRLILGEVEAFGGWLDEQLSTHWARRFQH